jgi:hypothetical protein
MNMPKKKAAAKKAAAPKSTNGDMIAPVILGYRAHDETEDHFPTCTFLMSADLCRYWAAGRRQTDLHADCVFVIEEVQFDPRTSHVLSHNGNLPEEPLNGEITWDKIPPSDLGPVWEQMSVETMRENNLPAATLRAAELAIAAWQPLGPTAQTNGQEANGKSETNGKLMAKKEAEEPTNGKPLAPNSIGTSHPVPKPGAEAGHRPSGHRSLKLSSAKSKGRKANGKSKSKQRA